MFSNDPQYRFPGYEEEDIYQECFIIGIEAAKHYNQDSSATLFTYLYRCIKNRLSNLKRDKFLRTGSCSIVSQKVNNAEELEDTILFENSLFKDAKTLMQEIDNRIPFELRDDWTRMKEGCSVQNSRKQKILEIIHELDSENSVDTNA